MKLPLLALAMGLPCIGAILCAGYMALNGVDGWGWFLFVAVLLGGFSVRSDG